MRTNIVVLLLVIAVPAALWMGCAKEPPASIYDPSVVTSARPAVTGFLPQPVGVAGVSVVTIIGEGFSPVAYQNMVFFNNTSLPILQASATQLQVKAPSVVQDSIPIKVGVVGSDYFSHPAYYTLVAPTIERFSNFTPIQLPAAIECDRAGNMYVSVIDGSIGKGIWKFDSLGNKTVYAPVFSSAVGVWKGMKFGRTDTIFAVAGKNIIFYVPPGGGQPGLWLAAGGLGALNDLDFDANGNIWASGNAGSIYRVRPDKTVKSFPFVGLVRTVRVYAGAVYVGGRRDSLEKVWQFPILSGDDLGPEQEYFSVSSIYGANSYGVYAITFASDGSLMLGTDAPEGILLVHPGGTGSEAYYPGLLKAQTLSITFGSGPYLFQGRSATPGPAQVVRIYSDKTGAPYYGRTLP